MVIQQLDEIKAKLNRKHKSPIDIGRELGFKKPEKFFQIIYNDRHPTPNDEKAILKYFGLEPIIYKGARIECGSGGCKVIPNE